MSWAGLLSWPQDGVGPTGLPSEREDQNLVARLWPLGDLSSAAVDLIRKLERTRPMLDPGNFGSIPETFSLSAEVVRFLSSEPMLPMALTNLSSHTNELRSLYDDYEVSFGRLLQHYFVSCCD